MSSEEHPKSDDSAEERWGRLHVTRQCCGAANCRNFAPEILGEVSLPSVLPGSYEEGAFTGIIRQPRNQEEYLAARTAAAACGFAAIRLEKPSAKLPAEEGGSAWRHWPHRLEDNVWVLGQPSQKNYGALAYFIELPTGGVLVDVPRPSEELFRWLEAHGGVRWLFLTHRDHVQHHRELAARFPGCRRVIGVADVNQRQSSFADATDAVEIKLGNELAPMTLDGTLIPAEVLSSAELAVLPQPGHTPGSLCLLYRSRFLFTGDHLAYSRRLGHLTAHRLQCWEDWERQTRSVQQLSTWAETGQLRFQWLLPGHGEWIRFEDAGVSPAELRRAVEWMRQQPPGNVPLLRWIPFVLSRAKPRGTLARLVMMLGGRRRDSWLLPAASRQYLPDYQPGRSAVRLYAFAVFALAMVVLAVWLAMRGSPCA